MLQAELASSLVSDIYDAVIDPSLWRNVLEKSMRFVGGSAVSLFSKDATSRALRFIMTTVSTRFTGSSTSTNMQV